MTVGYLTRKEWNARPPRWHEPLLLPVSNIFTTFDIHVGPCYSAKKCLIDVQFIQQDQMSFGSLPDIKYSFLITAQGTIVEARGFVHCPGLPYRYKPWKNRSIYIALMGNFNRKAPPPVMYEARDELIEFGLRKGYIEKKVLEFNIQLN